MEEKLYFKPGGYGKGQKKEKDASSHRGRNLIIFLLILAIVIGIIVWLLSGKTVTSGNFPGPTKINYLVCEKQNPEYDIITLRDPLSSDIKVTFSISESGEMNSTSLAYTSVYNDERGAYDSRNVTHGVFGQALADSGLSAEAFSNKFTLYDNKLIITLTASKGELTSRSAEFFALKDFENLDFSQAVTKDYQLLYEKQGYSCKNSTEN